MKLDPMVYVLAASLLDEGVEVYGCDAIRSICIEYGEEETPYFDFYSLIFEGDGEKGFYGWWGAGYGYELDPRQQYRTDARIMGLLWTATLCREPGCMKEKGPAA